MSVVPRSFKKLLATLLFGKQAEYVVGAAVALIAGLNGGDRDVVPVITEPCSAKVCFPNAVAIFENIVCVIDPKLPVNEILPVIDNPVDNTFPIRVLAI